ncbi:hypothetical protein AM433_004550 [Pseudomonas aeruginosa]|uniref:phage antirepressor KilAC domain-containing protein n=1 Tax=Pseudomonas aeruginosa TaxID=287 RepID=UPI0009AACB87|nr:phage regulatory protein/antirepressor Ant [Pseudomonas aeruginosa]OKN71661.1 hypothetical protein AM433_004550 [Pseudomonas aeruginosa]SST10429.1 DNA-binding protein [Acinetobacter baumannii]
MSQVAVIQQGPVLTMSSREIADLTGKKHKNVLRDIREMLEALRRDGSDLSHVREDLDSRGYTENFHLDRDLTETLISGYSVPLRYRVIRRLHELESSQVPSIPTSLPEALRLAADQAEQNQALRLVINEQAPKVQALERLSGAAGTMCITDAAKHLKVSPSRLFDWLQQNRWIYRRSGSARWIGYQPRIQDGWIMHKVTVLGRDDQGDERAASQVRITAKGLSVLARKIEEGKL